MTISDVYNSRILEFAGNISRTGRLDAPDASAKAHSRLCGSTVTVDVVVRDGVVSDYAADVKACALGQSSASIVARNVIGRTPDELKRLRDSMRQFLKENGPAPTAPFEDLAFLEPVRDYRARHASTLLVFDALADALDQVEAREAA